MAILRNNAPVCGIQTFNFLEVAATGYQDHFVTFRRGGNPDVVLGKWPPLLLQALLQASVFTSNIEIARDNGSADRESLTYHSLASTRSRASSIAWAICLAETASIEDENRRNAAPRSPLGAETAKEPRNRSSRSCVSGGNSSTRLAIPCLTSIRRVPLLSRIHSPRTYTPSAAERPACRLNVDPAGLPPRSPECRLDRHRGGGHPPTPATPPCVRVRTRRFERLR